VYAANAPAVSTLPSIAMCRNSSFENIGVHRINSTACHVAVVAGCEGEALLLGEWVKERREDLEALLDNISVVSLSWLAADIAPVGHFADGSLRARAVGARLWIVVTMQMRFAHCPTTAALLETLLESGTSYLELRVDEDHDNVCLVTPEGLQNGAEGRRQKEVPDQFEMVEIERDFPTHAGGLIRSQLQRDLV